MIGVGRRHVWKFWWAPSGITFCQLPHWQTRDGDSHKVQKVLICFTKSLECIVLMLLILPTVLGFVCIQMVVVVQGRPQLRLQKSSQFQVPKTNPKLAPCTCLSWSLQSFLFCSVDESGPLFPKPAIEALRGSARPGRGHAADAKPIDTRTKRGSWGLETI